MADTDANMIDSSAAASHEAQPRLTFSSIRPTISEPPASSSTTSFSIPAIAPCAGEVDPLDQAVNLPSNYVGLDESTQTSALLTATHALLSSHPHTSALATHTITQRHLASSLIASHALSLRYLDALNRINTARTDLASYIDARAPRGRCTREWRLGDAEGLLGELGRWVGVARGLRGEACENEKTGETGGLQGTGEGRKSMRGGDRGKAAPAGLGAAVQRMEGSGAGKGKWKEGNLPPVGSLQMEIAKEFLERAGPLGVSGGGGGGGGGACGGLGALGASGAAASGGGKKNQKGKAEEEGMHIDYGQSTPRETGSRRSISGQGGIMPAAAAKRKKSVVGVREIGRVIGEVAAEGVGVGVAAGEGDGESEGGWEWKDEGAGEGEEHKKDEAEDVEMAGAEDTAGSPGGQKPKEVKKRKAEGMGVAEDTGAGGKGRNGKTNKWAKAFGDMVL